ncbi:hypothetical protein LNQ03_31245 [Klebsiella pneumoniae subsp. pneumoniae]|nr:hypothetical protein [Klebsiella pneumoniae subsp. pneumoniae]
MTARPFRGPGNQALLDPFTDALSRMRRCAEEAASDSHRKIKHRLLLKAICWARAFMGLSAGLMSAAAGRAGAGYHLWPAGN